jgi:hypothetical protein
MPTIIHVETFKNTAETRLAAREGRVPRIWTSAWVVRFRRDLGNVSEAVAGGGSSQRVAAMRAAEAAVEKGWF